MRAVIGIALVAVCMMMGVVCGSVPEHPAGVSSAAALADVPLLSLVLNTHSGERSLRPLPLGVNEPSALQLAPHETQEAWGKWADDVEKTGWAYLQVHSNHSLTSPIQAFAAGYFEGTVSQLRIWQSAVNQGVQTPLDSRILSFLAAQHQWLETEIKANVHSEYWRNVDLVDMQLRGLHAGYAKAAPAAQQLTFFQIQLLSLGAEIEDIAAGVIPSYSREDTADDRFSHCSALVKWLPDRSDLIISQVTWSTFNSMLRVFKLYDLPYKHLNGSLVAAEQVSFSSYPGSLLSGDDFYLLSSGMVSQETTIGIYNDTVYKTEIKPKTVPEYVRNIVANRLARNGVEWADIFVRFNSGTYNNQWMILDYKLYTPGLATLAPGTFWFVEQMPGFIEAADLTYVIARDGYFGAYNIAYFKSVLVRSGGQAMIDQFGPWYSYENTARAQIFRRDHSKVTNLDGMKQIMRYNDFFHDPLSLCAGCNPPYTGENAIAARCDLNDPKGTYPISAWGFRNHCGTDAKIASYALAKKFQVVTQSGPTYDNLPPFVFSTGPFANVTHLGLPDRFQFPWVVVDFSTVHKSPSNL